MALDLGARWLGAGRARFRVWAPRPERLELRLDGGRQVELARDARGYAEATVDGLQPGARYVYLLDGERERPDPVSRHLPLGLAGPSELVDPSVFSWEDDAWSGLPLEDCVFYELHVGTFTSQGTFDAVIGELDDLRDLGVTAVELMPVAEFPGPRNWGYDGASPFAVQSSYGGPEGLRRLVDACHRRGMAVALDVVYNHLGPEGNHLAEFGEYFADRYRTPWGAALNYDGPGSDEVRRHFISNALYWIDEFHVDALRLDAIHGIVDVSARPFLSELAAAVHAHGRGLGRAVHLVAESDLNDVRILDPEDRGGFGIDGHWNDDFHHALHAVLTGEVQGYYRDFGTVEHLAKAHREGFVLSGGRSEFRGRRHGSSSACVEPPRLVVFAQNHDQIGNRPAGRRLSAQISFEALKLAAGATLLSPFTPLLFMGEEYGETAPFPYFVSHAGADLVEAVRRARCEEAGASGWSGTLPDPADEGTFLSARLDRGQRREGAGAALWELHRELLRLRRTMPALRHRVPGGSDAGGTGRLMWVRRDHGVQEALAVFNFSTEEGSFSLPATAARWRKRLDSADERWLGPGTRLGERLAAAANVILAPESFVLLEATPQ